MAEISLLGVFFQMAEKIQLLPLASLTAVVCFCFRSDLILFSKFALKQCCFLHCIRSSPPLVFFTSVLQHSHIARADGNGGLLRACSSCSLNSSLT
jgi:hypothetical protein